MYPKNNKIKEDIFDITDLINDGHIIINGINEIFRNIDHKMSEQINSNYDYYRNKKFINDKYIQLVGADEIKYKDYFEKSLKYSQMSDILKITQNHKLVRLNKYILMEKMINMDNDINEYYNIYDKIIAIRRDLFIDSILETLHKDESIVKQFLLDLPRTNVIINSQVVKNVDDIFNILKPYNRTIYLDRPKRDSMYLLLFVFLVICQSSFFIQYCQLYKKINKCKLTYPEEYKDIELFDKRERNTISFEITKDKMKIELDGSFKIYNINMDKDIKIIKPKMIIDMDKEYGVIIYL